MDNFTKYLQEMERRHATGLQVATVGWVPHKRGFVRHQFYTCNFSFIVRGSGHYCYGGQSYDVQAPAVFIQVPGVDYDYGPKDEWTELFLIFSADQQQALEQAGYLNHDRPLWQLEQTHVIKLIMDDLLHRLQNDQPLQADRIDRLAERLLLEYHLAAETEHVDDPIVRIRNSLLERMTDEQDAHALAAAEGLSPSHFRRLWNAQLPQPPGQWLGNQRVRAACRLLIETEKPVALIADEVGIPDPQYFSRIFRKFMHMSPREYRNHYHV